MSSHLRQVTVPDLRETGTDDPLTFEEFFEANRRRLFGSFCLITGNSHEAEEIVQDAFLKLWERWDRVAGLEDPGGFLFTTAMNVFRNRARRAALAVRKAIGPELRSDDLAAVEDRAELIRVLRPLTPRQRAALVLTDYLGYPSDEAARILGIEASTVRALSAKGRTAARKTQGGPT
jgi:RNA polymerase sigma-70 factor, ECF subfamily